MLFFIVNLGGNCQHLKKTPRQIGTTPVAYFRIYSNAIFQVRDAVSFLSERSRRSGEQSEELPEFPIVISPAARESSNILFTC